MFLSIAIPTFNRSKSLEATLNNIVNQVNNLNQNDYNIEIIVSNNASTDDTKNVLANEKFSVIKSFTQKENIGFDKNVDFLFSLAKGNFVWTLSDDDVVYNESIKFIYDNLRRNNDINFAFVNYIVSQNNKKIDSSYFTNQDFEIIDSNQVFTRIGFSNTLISSCVFKRDAWMSLNRSQYFGTAWIHLYMARDVLVKGKSLLIGKRLIEMSQPDLFESRNENNKVNGIEYYFYAHIKLVSFCDSLEIYGYPSSVKLNAIKFCQQGDVSHIINYKLTSSKYDLREISRIVKALYPFRYKFPSFYLFFLPLIFIPNFFYKAIKIVKNLFKIF